MDYPYLLADIGGTNTRLAPAAPPLPGEAWPRLGPVTRHRNADFPSLESLLAATGPWQPEALCFAAAGPVAGDSVTLTNHPWTITADNLRLALPGLDRVVLLNDLQAVGHALAAPPAGTVLHPGQPDPAGPRLAVNIGTGFNIAPWYPGPGGPRVPAAEAGFFRMAFEPGEAPLRDHLRAETGRLPVVEDLLSGRGLESLGRFCGCGARSAPDIARGSDDAARATRSLATVIIARVLADLAMIHRPTGGIYLVGSVATGLQEELSSPSFREAFLQDHPYHALLEATPVVLLDDPDLPLRGTALCLLNG
ncbi:glucokinase [Pseudooceanicola nanhaiensis]|uniref:glucokinase n=1 Tax=Pseudooceanicola nanhaiensis TaxID=375761 RepID=UPI001CD6B101|nr:glucokinase [Pseudooceanicola nanhaiensis]MCA0921660.1 glucokinase [Pseudooceanicola nanhaiensis]